MPERGGSASGSSGRRARCSSGRAGAGSTAGASWTTRSLPSGDRIAHLLLALREDEQGFATVADLAFSGARWRVRRRMKPLMRPALDRAVRMAR